MAGAMRLGELTHRMESRLVPGERPPRGRPGLFEALDARPRPRRVRAGSVAGRQHERGAALGSAGGAAPIAGAAGEIAATAAPGPRVAARGPPHLAPARRAGERDEPAAVESGARAMLRVRADLIDRLVNEAGEVPITRARVEGELRALKATGRIHRERDPPPLAGAGDRNPGGDRIQSGQSQVRRGTRASIRSNSIATPGSRSSPARWRKASTTRPCSSRC